MGSYYGLRNLTKKHNVSSYWKGSPPSITELKEIMVKLGWDETDNIVSYCYCDGYVYKDGEWKEPSQQTEETEEKVETEQEDKQEDKQKKWYLRGGDWKCFHTDDKEVCKEVNSKDFDAVFFCN